MVASYDKNTEYSAHDPDGVCLVWNTRFKKETPEHIFHCQSPVTVTTFARFHPHLIIGGTYSGQVKLKEKRKKLLHTSFNFLLQLIKMFSST